MKNSITIFAAFFFGLMLTAFTTVAVPTVTLTNNSSYDVAIDGRYYSGNNTYTINNLAAGNHSVGVYRVEGGLFNKKRTLISSSQFNLANTNNNSAVNINVNQNGQVRVNQNGYNNDQNDNDNHNGNYDQNGNSKKYGKSEGKGRGHKYGHYKNHNQNNNINGHEDHDQNEND